MIGAAEYPVDTTTGGSTGWIDVPLFRRAELALGQRIGGPAIVEEYGATTVMPPSWSLHADRYRNLILVSGR